MENKVRRIVADMLLNMDDNLKKTNKRVKDSENDIKGIRMEVAEVNMKLDREAKIRDLVDQLKIKISSIEKGMEADI